MVKTTEFIQNTTTTVLVKFKYTDNAQKAWKSQELPLVFFCFLLSALEGGSDSIFIFYHDLTRATRVREGRPKQYFHGILRRQRSQKANNALIARFSRGVTSSFQSSLFVIGTCTFAVVDTVASIRLRG